MKRHGLSLVLLLAVLTMGGCATGNGGQLPDPVESRDLAQLGYRLNWATTLDLQRGGRLDSATRLDDVIVAVEEPSHIVSGISTRTGEILWQQRLGDLNQPMYEPVRIDDRIMLNSNNHLFTLQAGNGELLALDELRHVASTGPVVADGLLVFGAINGRVWAQDVTTTAVRWQYMLTARILAQPQFTDKRIFAADANGVYALWYAVTRELLWRARTFGAVVAEPAIDELTAYLPSVDQTLYAVDLRRGQDRWRYYTEVPLTISPLLAGETLYLPLPGEAVAALDAQTGEEKWKLDMPLTPVTVVDDELILYNRNKLVAVSTETGRVLAETPTAMTVEDVLLGPDGDLILVSSQGRMIRINKD
ncbi:MAG: PQQ-binding-like beta-propeller repeat protein [Phycisphaeraceae bacterium]